MKQWGQDWNVIIARPWYAIGWDFPPKCEAPEGENNVPKGENRTENCMHSDLAKRFRQKVLKFFGLIHRPIIDVHQRNLKGSAYRTSFKEVSRRRILPNGEPWGPAWVLCVPGSICGPGSMRPRFYASRVLCVPGYMCPRPGELPKDTLYILVSNCHGFPESTLNHAGFHWNCYRFGESHPPAYRLISLLTCFM
jgi:hypothetical protein